MDQHAKKVYNDAKYRVHDPNQLPHLVPIPVPLKLKKDFEPPKEHPKKKLGSGKKWKVLSAEASEVDSNMKTTVLEQANRINKGVRDKFKSSMAEEVDDEPDDDVKKKDVKKAAFRQLYQPDEDTDTDAKDDIKLSGNVFDHTSDLGKSESHFMDNADIVNINIKRKYKNSLFKQSDLAILGSSGPDDDENANVMKYTNHDKLNLWLKGLGSQPALSEEEEALTRE